ncbi:MAG TPA: hypothetical protein VJ725_12900 [Thermoanaerobaculia bacterium]|nr:hypothetical protein [Thermoanaerobaculia bacterium]
MNRSARRTVSVLILLSLAALPVAAEPARSRPAGPAAIFSELVTRLTEQLLSLWEKTDPPPPPPTDRTQTSDCRSTIDPWGCPKP